MGTFAEAENYMQQAERMWRLREEEEAAEADRVRRRKAAEAVRADGPTPNKED